VSQEPAIEVRNLHYRYKDANEEALQGLSFAAPFGRISGLLGPNGSGKSTAFKIISTQILPTAGESFVGGFSSLRNSKSVRQLLGVTFQSPSLDPILTITENLQIHAALLGLGGPNVSKSIAEKLEFLQLTDRAHSRVKVLSGGLARRAELAKTLLGEPKILLLDEPTTGLDPLARLEFWNLLRKLANRGVGVLVTTHMMEEAELCDELFFIANGKLAASGSPQSLKQTFPFEVLWLEGTLQISELENKFRERVQIRKEASRIRVETERGQEILDEIRSGFGAQLQSFTWGKASLADVYFSKTGVKLQ
jgi:ABC-2 type transport system ATP-binding protein